MLCRAMYKSISKKTHREDTGDSNIPGISCVNLNNMAAVPPCTFVLTIKELDNEQNNYDQRDL